MNSYYPAKEEEAIKSALSKPEIVTLKEIVLHPLETPKINTARDNSSPSTSDNPRVKGWRRFTGYILTIFSCICLSLGALIVKGFLPHYNKVSLASWRFLGVFLSIGFALKTSLIKKKPILDNVLPHKPENRKRFLFLILRAIVGSTGLICLFSSFNYLAIADSLVIGAGSPIFVQIIAAACLGEKCDLILGLTAIFALIGISLIARPPFLTGEASFSMDTLIGSLLAFGNTIFTSLTVITLRYLKEVHYSLVTSFFGAWGCLQCLFVSLAIYGVFDVPQGLSDIFLVSLMALLTAAGQIALTKALKAESAGPVSVVRSSEVIFAFIWQFIFLGTVPDVFSIVGALIILACLVFTGYRKWVESLPVQVKTQEEDKCSENSHSTIPK